MATTITRRPLPALVSLLALLVLTALVWWRVIERDPGSSTKAGATPTRSVCPTVHPGTRITELGAPGTVTVVVLNSTSRAGIAGKARTVLLADGFKVPQPAGNDDPSVSIPTAAQIRYGAAGADGARLLSFYFPGATLTLEKNLRTATVTVSLGDAFARVATAGQARAAMAAQHVTLRTASVPATGATSTPPTSPAPSRAGNSTSPPC